MGDGDTKEEKVFQNITSYEEGEFGREMSGKVSAECVSAVDGFLTKDPVKRLGGKGIHDVMGHSWFKDVDWDGLKKGTAISPQGEHIKDLFEHVPDEAVLKQMEQFEQIQNEEDEGIDGDTFNYVEGFDGF